MVARLPLPFSLRSWSLAIVSAHIPHAWTIRGWVAATLVHFFILCPPNPLHTIAVRISLHRTWIVPCLFFPRLPGILWGSDLPGSAVNLCHFLLDYEVTSLNAQFITYFSSPLMTNYNTSTVKLTPSLVLIFFYICLLRFLSFLSPSFLPFTVFTSVDHYHILFIGVCP